MQLFDKLFRKAVAAAGALLPNRPTINFVGATVTDDPANEQTTVTFTGGSGGSPTGAAGGALNGTYPNPGILNGTVGQLLATVAGPVVSWVAAAGDWTGAITANVVARINGATVPAAGSLVTGNALRVSGASALSYAALNLAGGINYVTGILPSANGGTGLNSLGSNGTIAQVVSGAFAWANAVMIFGDVAQTTIQANRATPTALGAGVVGGTALGSDTTALAAGVAANYASIGGGDKNAVQGAATHGCIPGGLQNLVTGQHGFATNYFNTAAGTDSCAFGFANSSAGAQDICAGYIGSSAGQGSACFGGGCVAGSAGGVGDYAFAAGSSNSALANYSAAFGTVCIVSPGADGGFACGRGNYVRDGNGFVSGQATTAVGRNSMANGEDTIAWALRSATFGEFTQSLGIGSIAAGIWCASPGQDSMAFGDSACAPRQGQFAIASGRQQNGVGDSGGSWLMCQGSTPGAAQNETANLRYAGGTLSWLPEDGKAYDVSYRATVAALISGVRTAHTVSRTATVMSTGGTVTVVQDSATVVVPASGALSTAVLSITATGATLTPGPLVQAATSITARLTFSEVKFPDFSPLDLAGVTGYWDADLGVTSSGSLVSAWANQALSPPANTAWLASTTARPTIIANVANGHSALRFNGSTNVMSTAGALSALLGAGAGYVLIIGTFGAIATNFAIGSCPSNASPFSDSAGVVGVSAASAGPLNFGYIHDGGGLKAGYAAAPAIGSIFVNSLWYDSTTVYEKVGLGLMLAAPIPTLAGAPSSLAGTPQIGANGTKAAFFQGDIYAIVTMNRAPTYAEFFNMRGWAAQRWNDGGN